MTKRTLRTKSVSRKQAAKSRPLPRMARAPKPEKAAPVKQGLQYIADLMKLDEAKALVEQLQRDHDATNPKASPFDCGEVNQKAPLTTLIAAMFEAPNAWCKFADPGAELMANMLLTLSDEAELTAAANNGVDLGEVKDRANMRLEYRARIAVEIARRLQTGEVTS